MKQVTKTYHQRYEIKKSIFISYLTPIDNFQQLMDKLKEEHPKATHIIYAYRKLNEFDQIVENQSDDNEPKGCAGQPTLAILRGEDIINSAILTVRYFGGIKLGVGGMIRAYSFAAKEVVNLADFIDYKKRFLHILKTPYPLINRYEHYLKKHSIKYKERDFQEDLVIWKLYLTEDEIQQLKEFEQNL